MLNSEQTKAINEMEMNELSSLVDTLAEIRHFDDLSEKCKSDIDQITEIFFSRQEEENRNEVAEYHKMMQQRDREYIERVMQGRG